MGRNFGGGVIAVAIALLMLAAIPNNYVTNMEISADNSQKESSIISNPTVSPSSTTIRLANNSLMSNVTFSYSASSSGQIIPPDNISLVHDIRSGGGSSLPDAFVSLGNELLFAANDGIVGEELWKSDGTSNGTVMIKDIRPGNEGSGIVNPIAVGSTIFFYANDGTHGGELWKTDGTSNGTVLVKDINPNGSSSLSNFIALGNKLIFRADDGTHGNELWISDGTPSGTYMVKDIRSGAGSSNIEYMVVYKDKVYFRGLSNDYGNELWTSDGTSNGTYMVMDIRPGSASSSIEGIVSAGNNLYFVAKESSNKELYVSNGTLNGTHKITNLGMTSASDLTAAGDNIFFQAGGFNIGRELIFSNGTANGTIVIDILPGLGTNNLALEGRPKYMTYHQHDGHVYFYARTQPCASNATCPGYQFFKSDGTVNGTTIVSDVAKNSWKCNQNNPSISAGRYVYFVMLKPGEGDRHWYRTDGTVNGTSVLGEFAPGQFLRHPGNSDLTVIDGTLFVSSGGDNSNYGYELYSIKNSTGIIAEPTWSAYPDLPNGITINPVTGEVSGTPTVVQNTTQYTIWANTSLESASATMYIEVVGAPEFSYEPANLNLVRLHSMPSSIPISFGGVVESWEIVPELPSGLDFDLVNGEISGIPTVNQPTSTYTIWGNNSAGAYSFDITINISEEPPNIVYQDPSVELTQYIRMVDLVPNSNGGLIDSWSIDPQLPLGLFFDNGTISGIPAINQSEQSYTVWANNSEGSDSDIITIQIAAPPLGIVVSQTELVLVEEIEMDIVSLTYIGGNVTSWELDGELPPGIVFDNTNLTITGTSSEIGSSNVTIWANTTLMSDYEIIQISVLKDTDGDGMPDDFGGLVSTFLSEDSDDDNDGLSDVSEQTSTPPTDHLLADTDGDGVCDGEVSVTYDEEDICSAGFDYFPTDPSADSDTDGDGLPDEIRLGFNTTLVEDNDDDGDGISDDNESSEASLSSPKMPDTDGDGICDGSIEVTIRDSYICDAGPDDFPNDSSAYLDTDSDGLPDEIVGESSTGLVEDLDDDGDQSSDISEIENGTDPKDPLSFPTDDNDSDGWTNSQENFCGTDEDDASSVPVDRDGDKWCDVDDPDDDNDGWSDLMEKECGSNYLDADDVPGDDDGDGICNLLDSDNEDSSSFPIWVIFLIITIGLIVAGYLRMGNISKQMDEVIANTQYDATDQIWEESEDEEESDD